MNVDRDAAEAPSDTQYREIPMNCKSFKNELADLLLAQAETIKTESKADARSLAAAAHMEACPPCREEYQSLSATMSLLDAWQAPEPSPYFDQKLAVRLREEQDAEPMGWFERLKTRLLFNTGRQFRPALAGALALVLIVGGGTVAEFTGIGQQHPTQASATVGDLQILDRNEQALQQMDQLMQDDDSGNNNSEQPQQSGQPIS